MIETKNPYHDSRLKRNLDISIATAALPAYFIGISACALVDSENSTAVHKRARSDGEVFEVAKLNTKHFKRLGRFVVRSGLDEIPQVTNILKGTMSIVGPRALLPEDFDAFLSALPRTLRQAWQEAMPGIKPGIISTYALAEHAGRNGKDRAIMDIYDADNASFKRDLHLISRLGRVPNLPLVLGLESYEDELALEPMQFDAAIETQSIEPIFEIGEDVA